MIKKYYKICTTIVLSVFITSCMTTKHYTRHDVTIATLKQDKTDCYEDARQQAEASMPKQGSIGGTTLGGLFVSGFSQGITISNRTGRYYRKCLDNIGYKKFEMSFDQSIEFGKLTDEKEKNEFLQNFWKEKANEPASAK